MLGLCTMRFCRGGFNKLDILTVKSLYVFALIIFVVRNPEHSSTHSKDARQKKISDIFYNSDENYILLYKNI
jgi:hypothetical protein